MICVTGPGRLCEAGASWPLFILSSFAPLSSSILHTILVSLSHTHFERGALFLFLSPPMALRSVSSVSQLLHTNGRSEPFPSILASGNAHLLLDFTTLHCKSNRRKRYLGAFAPRRGFHHYVTKTSSSCKAVLELDRRNHKALHDSAVSSSDSKPQVRLYVDR